MKALICGGRDYGNAFKVYGVLSRHGITEICHGGAAGADALAHGWAIQNGVRSKIYRADWKTLGKKAGPTRNQKMLEDFRPEIVIAFPGGKGTADMVGRARKAGVKTIEIDRVTNLEK